MSLQFARLPRIAMALAVVFAFAPAAFAHEFAVGALAVDHPWARATPHGARVAAGFLTIENKGTAADRLLAVDSEIAEHGEIHSMTMKDGVMTMRPLPDGLDLPGAIKVELQPGGYHIMFIGLKRMLKKGDHFAATLTFEKAGKAEVTFTVEAIGAGGAKHH